MVSALHMVYLVSHKYTTVVIQMKGFRFAAVYVHCRHPGLLSRGSGAAPTGNLEIPTSNFSWNALKYKHMTHSQISHSINMHTTSI